MRTPFPLTLGFLAIAACAHPCAIVSRGDKVLLAGEQALIVWDPATGTEHFVRRATFDSDTSHFGFVIPTPTAPVLRTADDRVFERLARLAGPLVRSMYPESRSKGGGSVEVVSVQQVGEFQATVLRAKSAAALDGWLKRNGYRSSPSLKSWLAHYVRQRWYFTALKLSQGHKGPSRTKAICATFRTDNPVYPYKMPAGTWPKGWRRPMTLYLVGPYGVGAFYASTPLRWEAASAGMALSATQSVQLAADLGLDPTPLAKGAFLTAFKNGSRATDCTKDLVFRPNAQSDIGRLLSAGQPCPTS